MSPGGAASDGGSAPSEVELATVPFGRPAPFPVEGIVREEDTHLVLSAERSVRPPSEDLETLERRTAQARPRRPGTVEVREGDPVELLAVVHDLDREPTWREMWVESALEETFREAEARELRRLTLPILGAVHGELHPFRFLTILRSVLARVPCPELSAICLEVPRRVDPRDVRALAWLWTDGPEGPPPEPSSGLREAT